MTPLRAAAAVVALGLLAAWAATCALRDAGDVPAEGARLPDGRVGTAGRAAPRAPRPRARAEEPLAVPAPAPQASPSASAPRRRVRVTVTDLRRQAVAGARVAVYDEDRCRLVSEGRSDDAGVVELDAVEWIHVLAGLDDRAAAKAWVAVAASGTTDVAVRLDQGVQIRGVAVTEAGKPVAGVVVEVWLPNDHTSERGRSEERGRVALRDGNFAPASLRVGAESDGAGRFAFPSLPMPGPRGQFQFVVDQAGWVPQIVGAPGIGPADRDVRIVVRPSVTVTGRVLGPGDRPLDVFMVAVGDRPGRSVVRDDGRFSVDFAARGERIVVWEPEPTEVAAAEIVVPADAGASFDAGDVRLPAPGEIVGTVVREDGSGVSGATVTATGGGTRMREVTGEGGRFRFAGVGRAACTLATTVTAAVPAAWQLPGGGTCAYAGTATARAGEDVRLVVRTDPVVVLRFRDASGTVLGAPRPDPRTWATPGNEALREARMVGSDRMLLPLRGVRPWTLRLAFDALEPVELTIDEDGPVIERTVTLVSKTPK